MCFMEGQGVDGHVGYDIFVPVQCSECQIGEKFKTSADKRQE